MKIITGKTGTNHVTSDDDRNMHAGILGSGSYVLNTGLKLAATIESANVIRLASGDICHQGTHARIPFGEYEDVQIDNGTTGYKRKDLIVARYEKAGGIESMTVDVIKGTPAASSPMEPEYTEGNILEGATVSEMPLYIVNLDGVNVDSLVSKFSILTAQTYNVYTKAEIDTKVATLTSNVNTAQSTANAGVSAAATAQATANAGVSAAATAQATANSAASIASKGYVLAAAPFSNFAMNAGSGGLETITEAQNTITVPAGTTSVVCIIENQPSGTTFISSSVSISGTSCTITVKGSNAASSAKNITMRVLAFASASLME